MDTRVFTADYDKSDIAVRVWVPLGVAAVMGMTGLLAGLPMLSLIAAILTLIALRSWPLTRVDRPALKLSQQGVEIDGLGEVQWKDVTEVTAGVVQVKSVKMPAADLTFRRPLAEVFAATDATRLRPWEIRVFKLRRDGKLRIDLGKMEDDPDAILSAFQHFHSQTRVV